MTTLTDEAREFVASMASLPWQFQVGGLVLVVVIIALAKVTEFDPYALRQMDPNPTDPEAPDVCGATDGDLYCTLRPHAGDLHLDETRGTQYHSATFRGGEVG